MMSGAGGAKVRIYRLQRASHPNLPSEKQSRSRETGTLHTRRGTYGVLEQMFLKHGQSHKEFLESVHETAPLSTTYVHSHNASSTAGEAQVYGGGGPAPDDLQVGQSQSRSSRLHHLFARDSLSLFGDELAR